ncbi:hypothetical protein MRX96_011123 [Rhipicephalus microplus]
MLQDSSVGERTITESFADNSGTELAYLTYWALAETRRKEGVDRAYGGPELLRCDVFPSLWRRRREAAREFGVPVSQSSLQSALNEHGTVRGGLFVRAGDTDAPAETM